MKSLNLEKMEGIEGGSFLGDVMCYGGALLAIGAGGDPTSRYIMLKLYNVAFACNVI